MPTRSLITTGKPSLLETPTDQQHPIAEAAQLARHKLQQQLIIDALLRIPTPTCPMAHDKLHGRLHVTQLHVPHGPLVALVMSVSNASRQCSGVLSASSLNITTHCMAGTGKAETAGGGEEVSQRRMSQHSAAAHHGMLQACATWKKGTAATSTHVMIRKEHIQPDVTRWQTRQHLQGGPQGQLF
jgi:hypothetical protein